MATIQPEKVTLKSGKHLNVAKAGTKGPAILFLHGFPGSWYSWRHQLLELSKHYQAIALDLPGYGDSSALGDWSSYSTLQIIGDLVDLLAVLSLDKVFLVGHDWGAILAWHFCLVRPDRVKAMVNTSVAFMFRNPWDPPIPTYRYKYGDGFYMCRFQDPENVKKELSRCEIENVVKGFYWYFGDKYVPVLARGQGFDDLFRDDSPLPSFLVKEDVDHFADTYQKTGYVGALNYYRAIDQTWEEMGAYEGLKITTPVNFVVGDRDAAYHLDGVQEYIKNGGLEKDVPNVEITIWSGVGRFLNEEVPDKLSLQISDYFAKFN